ncbi:hypothetical protein CGLAUT_04975 [Corynebacterium glaucum]|nr:hypothetical protein CGLAUT_04975 [Corynebacterium glaucum]
MKWMYGATASDSTAISDRAICSSTRNTITTATPSAGSRWFQISLGEGPITDDAQPTVQFAGRVAITTSGPRNAGTPVRSVELQIGSS